MRLFPGVLFILFFTTKLSAQVPPADSILQAAFAKAAPSNKKVLLILHASWCGWCRKMDSSLADANVKPLIDKNYEIAHLTVYESPNKKSWENPGALEWLTKNGGADKGLPYWFVVGKDGVVLADSKDKAGDNTGCPASEEEVAHFISVLRKTSTLSEKELEIIKKRFRQNE